MTTGQFTTVLPSGVVTNTHVAELAAIDRTKLATESLKYNVPLQNLRVHDAFQTNLPTTASSDDLGLIIGTFATDAVVIQTSDAKATTVTQRGRFIFQLPESYVSGQTFSLCAIAGMKTTVSDGTATIDFEAYLKDTATGLVGADLVSTAATTINSLTPSVKTFTVDPTSLVAGSDLDIRVTIAITDTATATAVIGRIMRLYALPSVKG